MTCPPRSDRAGLEQYAISFPFFKRRHNSCQPPQTNRPGLKARAGSPNYYYFAAANGQTHTRLRSFLAAKLFTSMCSKQVNTFLGVGKIIPHFPQRVRGKALVLCHRTACCQATMHLYLDSSAFLGEISTFRLLRMGYKHRRFGKCNRQVSR